MEKFIKLSRANNVDDYYIYVNVKHITEFNEWTGSGERTPLTRVAVVGRDKALIVKESCEDILKLIAH